jgi:hypothetical protein
MGATNRPAESDWHMNLVDSHWDSLDGCHSKNMRPSTGFVDTLHIPLTSPVAALRPNRDGVPAALVAWACLDQPPGFG